MNTEQIIVESYEAWNDGDIDRLLYHMDAECVHHDTYFSDIVPYRNFRSYFEQDFGCRRITHAITDFIGCASDSARVKYEARIVDNNENEIVSYAGAEQYTLRHGKIIRFTDWYDASPHLLAVYYGTGTAADETGEQITLEAYVAKMYRCRSDLMRNMREKRLYISPDLSLSDISNQVGHPAELIAYVAKIAFGHSVPDFLERFRVETARNIIEQQVLIQNTAPSRSLDRQIAHDTGFSSHRSFVSAFEKIFHQTPCRFRLERKKAYRSASA